MPPATKKAAPKEPPKSLAALREAMGKKYGTGRIVKRSEVKPYTVISTGSIEVDAATVVGGVVVGRITEFAGVEGSAKTTTTINVMANAQRTDPRTVGYIDMEQDFDWDWAEANGLDTSDKRFFYAFPDDSEDVSDQAAEMIRTGLFSVLVVDSVGGMESKQAFTKEAEDHVMGRNAQVITRMVKRLAVLARKHHCAVILVNQFRCLAEGTLISTNQGVLPVEQVRSGMMVAGPAGRSARVQAVSATGVVSGRALGCWGRPELRISDTHRQIVLGANATLPEVLGCHLSPGDWLVQPLTQSAGGGSGGSCSIEDATLFGLHFADGHLGVVNGVPKVLTFTERSEERRLLVAAALRRRYGVEAIHVGKWVVSLRGRKNREDFLSWGPGGTGESKRVPDAIMAGGVDVRRAFLRGASLDTHGFTGCGGFLWTAECREHLRVISAMLLEFGVHGDLRQDKTNKGDHWHLYVTGDDAVRYRDNVGFVETSKTAKAEVFRGSAGARGKKDFVPLWMADEVASLLSNRGIAGRSAFPYAQALKAVRHQGLNASRQGLLSLCEQAAKQDEVFRPYVDLLTFNRFIEIESILETSFSAFDLQVEGGLFVAEGFLTHNSNLTNSMASDITAGPKALKYATSMRLDFRSVGGVEDRLMATIPGVKEPQVVGVKIAVRVQRSKVGPQGRNGAFFLIKQVTPEYGPIGIDRATEALSLGIDTGVIVVEGGGYHVMPWTTDKKDRIRGQAGVRDFLRAHPDRVEQIRLAAIATYAHEVIPEVEVAFDQETGEVLDVADAAEVAQ